MDKRVHTFPKSIRPKVNVIAQLEFELTYFEATVQLFSHYTTESSPFSLASLFNGISTFVGYLIQNHPCWRTVVVLLSFRAFRLLSSCLYSKIFQSVFFSLLQVFFVKLRSLHRTSNQTLYLIHGDELF